MTAETKEGQATKDRPGPRFRIEKDSKKGVILAIIETLEGEDIQRVTVEIIPPILEKHRVFGSEISRSSRMLDTLYGTMKKFEDGTANLKNADRNLEYLIASIDRGEAKMQMVYRGFLPLYAGLDEKACHAIERLFDGNGLEFVRFVLAGFKACELTEDERKNYSRAPSADSAPAPQTTATPAKPSSPTSKVESTDPAASEKK